MRLARVHGVQRNQNTMLWEQYNLKREQVVKAIEGHLDCPWASDDLPLANIVAQGLSYIQLEPLANEVLLFHGTSFEKASVIAKRGFDGSLCRRAFYGKGVYFSTDSCKIKQYDGGDDCNTVIVARVCLGHYFSGLGLGTQA